MGWCDLMCPYLTTSPCAHFSLQLLVAFLSLLESRYWTSKLGVLPKPSTSTLIVLNRIGEQTMVKSSFLSRTVDCSLVGEIRMDPISALHDLSLSTTTLIVEGVSCATWSAYAISL